MSLPEQSTVARSVERAPVAPAAGFALQLRAERMLVRAVPQLRYQLMRVGPAGLTGLAVLMSAVVAAIVVIMPAHRSVLALRDELTKSGHAVPSEARPVQTARQFSAMLPTRAQIPALLGVVLIQATDSGIVLDQGKYTFSAATSTRLARYAFEFPVKGDYASIRTFIDKSLAAVPALGLDKLNVERKNVGDTLVTADVTFVIYMRGA